MIRSFTLRDIPLVHRLSEQGVVFNTKSALIRDVHPLREALVYMLIGGEYPTYVWRADGGGGVGFAQLRQEEDETRAHILCLGSATENQDTPEEVLSEDMWIAFLEQLIKRAGKKGIQSLIAEVDEFGDELQILRHAGFAVYTRQDIWARPAETAARPIKYGELTFGQALAEDDWDINLLYSNIVPPLIQLVEPAPTGQELQRVWLLREDNQLSAFVHFADGPAGTWARLFVHPNAQDRGAEIVQAAIRVAPHHPERPLYYCVRRYQSWMQSALKNVGLTHMSSQAMMVRHTVKRTRKLVPTLSEEVKNKAVATNRQWFNESEPRTALEEMNNSVGREI